MTDRDHTHAYRHRRERRARKQADKALTAAVAAIGGGCAQDWPQDMPVEALGTGQDGRKGIGGNAGLCGKANGAVASNGGQGDE